MQYYRSQRVSSVIQSELNKLILKEVEFNNALVTIVGVDVSKKLDIALVRVSVIPSEKGEMAIRVLQKAQRNLQRLLLRKINIKPMPKLDFQLDHGLEHAADIEKLMLKQ